MGRASALLLGSGQYRAEAVNFDGTNDWLSKAAALTITDSKQGTLSLWIKFASDGVFSRIIETGSRPNLFRDTDNKVYFRCVNSAAVAILVMNTSAITAASGWKHIIGAWDLATSTTQIYVNDTSDATVTTSTNETIDYDGASNAGIGGTSAGADKISADVADVWFSTTFIDLSVSANRRKFIANNLKPVYLGPTGTGPGATPVIYLSGALASWETNKGTGGGFTENGALTQSATSPSD